MNRLMARCVAGLIATNIALLPALAAEEPRQRSTIATADPPTEPKENSSATILYKPPARGAPGGRIGGGTRDVVPPWFTLQALAPDHTGWTISAQPTLYWYVSKPTQTAVQFTLVRMDSARPMIEVRLKPMSKAGLYRLSLADHNASLSLGETYEWLVTVGAGQRSGESETVAGGTIERVQAPQALLPKLARARKGEAAILLAESSMWYDALQVLCDLIQEEPMNIDARRQRSALLKQVGLTGLALE